MNIIVCIKQVPDSNQVKINRETNTLVREGVPSIINPFDMYAIEEGLRIREDCGGKVTALSMGPPQAEEALREAISMGVDKAVLLSDKAFAGADTWATAYTLGKAIEKIGEYDLIICGKQAIDGDTAQVGPELAEILNIPFIAWVKKIEEIKDNYIKAERMMEDGYEVVEMNLPGLITVVKEINEPRLPSLKGKIKAKKAEIEVYDADSLHVNRNKVGLNGSATMVVQIFTPEPRGKGEMIEGSVEEQVGNLVDRLRKQKIV